MDNSEKTDVALEPASILVVDDNPQVLDTYRKVLINHELHTSAIDALERKLFGATGHIKVRTRPFQIDTVTDGQSGFGMVKKGQTQERAYAVAFIDMHMPGGWDGLETIEALWNADPDIQVVICTAFTDYSWEEIAARLGNTEQLLILQKPFEPIEVYQLASALAEKWFTNREHRANEDVLKGKVIETTEQILKERKSYENQLYHNATHDALTGLPNRSLLMDRLNQSLVKAKRSDQRLVVVVFGLDRFKRINESFGLTVADNVLKAICNRLVKELRESDTLARLGGDEFVLVLPDCDCSETLMRIIDRMVAIISRPIKIGHIEMSISCGVGCSAYPEDGTNAAALLRFAESAMYQAKENGNNNVQIHNPTLRKHIQQRLHIESELRHAVKENQLMIFYQPQVDLKSGRIVGLEALLRWKHEKLGMIPPSRFIPIAEETGLMKPITDWVLQQVCSQGKAWKDAGIEPPCIAVNVSAAQFLDVGFSARVSQCLNETGYDPALLELELTESVAMKNPEEAIPLMQSLKDLGVALSIDDFGTGYSNMHYLKRFPVDKLKLDGTFVKDITRDSRDLAIVAAIIVMAQQLGLKVIGEMAETEGQMINLARQGCDEVQGYYCSAPLPVEECEKLLRGETLPLPPALTLRGIRKLLAFNLQSGFLLPFHHELSIRGYNVQESNNTDDCLEIIAQENIGVLLCDQSCDLEFLVKVKNMYPNTVRLMLCENHDCNAITNAINQGGVYKFITPPIERNELFSIFSDAFKRHETDTENV